MVETLFAADVVDAVEVPEDTEAFVAEETAEEVEFVVEADFVVVADDALEVEETEPEVGAIVPEEPALSSAASCVGEETWSAGTQVPSCRPDWPGRQQKYSVVVAVSNVAFQRDQLSSAQAGVT